MQAFNIAEMKNKLKIYKEARRIELKEEIDQKKQNLIKKLMRKNMRELKKNNGNNNDD